MAKIQINKVAEILQKNKIEPAVLRRIIEEMNYLTQPEVGEAKPRAGKKQFVVLVGDPDGVVFNKGLGAPMNNGGAVAWVLQIPEDESPATTQDRILRAAYDFNASNRGRLLPVTTVGEAIENIPAKAFKETDLVVRTKTPVLVLRTDNKIPRE
jgi:hypothetical protein